MPLLATDRFDLLQLFLRVAESGQISGAARALGLSQPTASRFLRRLEDLLGRPLFDRVPRGLRLTEAGRDLLAPARRLIEDWQAATDRVKTEKDEAWRPPPITVSLAYSPARGRLPRVAALIEYLRKELEDDKGLGVAFIREAGATESIKRLGHRSRR